MASNEQFGKVPDNWPSIVAVVLLIVGAVWVQLPLEGQRPPMASVATAQANRVEARLWQDPFSAVEKARRASGGSSSQMIASIVPGAAKGAAVRIDRAVPAFRGSDPDKFKKDVGDRTPSSGAVVLGVMVFGGWSVGAEEQRRRTRYAVLSGLMADDYLPEDEEHIEVLVPGGSPEYVPYEWFTAKGKPPVVVLWLDEGALGDQASGTGCSKTEGPLSRLTNLLRKLTPKANSRIRYEIIGPADSTTLIHAADELTRRGKCSNETAKFLKKIGFISPFATLAQNSSATDKSLKDNLRRFLRAIPNDDRVVDALFDELRSRCIFSGDPMAIIGEWDTSYARQLRELIAQAHGGGTVEYGYMRGLDGRLPDPKGGADESKKTEDKKRDSTQVERPEGDAQVDYLRRLAAHMKEREQDLKVPSQSGRPPWCTLGPQFAGYRAIGVVGNDYYDKLLALRALRPVFPDAVFFTVDLEAAMLHPLDNHVTRNVIVASGWGLTLHEDLQRATPPFRDSYQTAAYFATRVALGVPDSTQLPEMRHPRVYEVGRSKFFELNAMTEKGSGSDKGGPQAGCTGLNQRLCSNPNPPAAPPGLPWPMFLAMTALIALALLMYGPLSRGLWQEMKQLLSRPLAAAGTGLVLVSVIALAVFAVSDARDVHGEPFAWVEGVSIWPSVLLRALALAIAVGGLIHAFRIIEWRLTRTEKSFFAVADAQSTPFQGSGPVQAWNEYREKMRPKKLAASAFAEWFVLLLLLITLGFSFPGPMLVPARSATSFGINAASVLIPPLLIQFLLVVVALCARRTNVLADRLSGKTDWPDATRREFGLPESSTNVSFDDWLDIQVIARQSEAFNNLFYYPFCALLLMVLARMRILDGWTTPTALALVFAVSFTYLIASGLRLRYTAERLRTNALRALGNTLVRLEGNTTSGKELAAQCRALIDQIHRFDRGAFQPFSQQPLVRAVLGLVGGVSGAALIQYAALASL